MQTLNELYYRISIAADFLESTWDGSRFAQKFENGYRAKSPYNILYHLHTISTLISLSEVLDRTSLLKIAQKAMEEIAASTFVKNSSKFYIYETESAFVWNSMCCIIYNKIHQTDEAIGFANSVIECAGDSGVSANYPPSETKSGSISHGVLALIQLYNTTKDSKYIEAAAFLAENIIKSSTEYDAYAVRGLMEIWEHDPDTRYAIKAKNIIRLFRAMEPRAMSSLFAANAMQACLGAKGKLDDLRDYQSQLYKQQNSHQILENNLLTWNDKFIGGFVKRTHKPEIRIDYAYQNAIAMMQYLFYLKNNNQAVWI